MSSPNTFSLAVCLFPAVTILDFQGPIELFTFLTPAAARFFPSPPNVTIESIAYLSHSMEPVQPTGGPRILPTHTYDDISEQFDIILIPGGPGCRPGTVPQELLDFVKRQAPDAKYCLSVCTGSWVLAQAGILDGERATSNKSMLQAIKKNTQHLPVEWVNKARWIVSENNKIWTSSGVTAGIDMANAFLTHLAGEDVSKVIRGVVELYVVGQEDDEFAAFHGLQ